MMMFFKCSLLAWFYEQTFRLGQQSIAAVLNDAEDQIAEYALSITKMKALMQQLLTGKRRVVV